MNCSEGTENGKRQDFGVLAATFGVTEIRDRKMHCTDELFNISSQGPGLQTREGRSEHDCLCFHKGLSIPGSSVFPTLILLLTQIF